MGRLFVVAALEAVTLEQLTQVVAGQPGLLRGARDVAGVASHQRGQVRDLERVDDRLLRALEAEAGAKQ